MNQHLRKVLIIEDNVDAAEPLRDVLVLEGHACIVALTGTAGVLAAAQNNVDVVLCDIGLPDMTGYDVGRALRASGFVGVLVAVTGYGSPAEARRAINAGFDHHLAKPPDLDELLAIVAGQVGDAPGPSIVVITGMEKPFRTTFTERYARVRQFGDEYRSRAPRSVLR